MFLSLNKSHGIEKMHAQLKEGGFIMRRNFLCSILSLLLVVALLAGCGGKTDPSPSANDPNSQGSRTMNAEEAQKAAENAVPEAGRKIKDKLIIGTQLEIDTLDPQNSTLACFYRMTEMTYEGLIAKDAVGNYVGKLATDWEWTSDTVCRFHLRKGVKFHNGEEMKASDVKFSIDRSVATPRNKTRWVGLKEVQVVDDYTVDLVFESKDGSFMEAMLLYGGAIMSEKFVNEVGDEIASKACGTGPFKVVSWTAGDKLLMERHEEYWNGTPPTKQLELRLMTEATARVIALETGEVDIIEWVPGKDRAKVADNQKLKMIETVGAGITYLGFNLTKEPYGDIRVRQAINYAIDRPAIVKAVLADAGIPAKSYITPAISTYYDGMEGYTRNVEKAKQLLADAGFPNGFKTTVHVKSSDSNTKLAAQIIQANLKDIGIELEILMVESTVLMDVTNNLKQDTWINVWTPAELIVGLSPFYSQTAPVGGNRMGYSNADVDKLYEQIKMETSDMDKRAKISADLQTLLVQECPWCPLYAASVYTGMNQNVEGVILMQHGYNNLTRAFAYAD